MAYTIKPTELSYLDVYVGTNKRPRRVPTAGSLPAPWLIRHNKIAQLPEDQRGAAWFEFFYELFREYVGPQVDSMTADQLNQLAEAWGDATEDKDGATAGE